MSDLLTPIFTTDEQDILRDRFDQVEALSGWDKNDVLKGDNRGERIHAGPRSEPTAIRCGREYRWSRRTHARPASTGLTGCASLLGNLVRGSRGAGEQREAIVAFDDGNILLGGGGSDTIEGRGGNDVIDGDAG